MAAGGVVPDVGFAAVAAVGTARTVVIRYAVKEDAERTERLYVRGFDEPTYRQVDFLGALNTYERFVVSPTEPALYVTATRVEGRGGWEQSLVACLCSRRSLRAMQEPAGLADAVVVPASERQHSPP